MTAFVFEKSPNDLRRDRCDVVCVPQETSGVAIFGSALSVATRANATRTVAAAAHQPLVWA
jgi:hypothetical protein